MGKHGVSCVIHSEANCAKASRRRFSTPWKEEASHGVSFCAKRSFLLGRYSFVEVFTYGNMHWRLTAHFIRNASTAGCLSSRIREMHKNHGKSFREREIIQIKHQNERRGRKKKDLGDLDRGMGLGTRRLICFWLTGLEPDVVFCYCRPSASRTDTLFTLRYISAHHGWKECLFEFFPFLVDKAFLLADLLLCRTVLYKLLHVKIPADHHAFLKKKNP